MNSTNQTKNKYRKNIVFYFSIYFSFYKQYYFNDVYADVAAHLAIVIDSANMTANSNCRDITIDSLA